MQGEGSVVRALHVVTAAPERWSAMRLVPAQCVRLEVVVHQEPGKPLYCYAIEASDPHTKELYAKTVVPAKSYSAVVPMPSAVSVDIRSMLLDVFDPDPF